MKLTFWLRDCCVLKYDRPNCPTRDAPDRFFCAELRGVGNRYSSDLLDLTWGAALGVLLEPTCECQSRA